MNVNRDVQVAHVYPLKRQLALVAVVVLIAKAEHLAVIAVVYPVLAFS